MIIKNSAVISWENNRLLTAVCYVIHEKIEKVVMVWRFRKECFHAAAGKP